MKKKLALLLAALMTLSVMGSTAYAISLSISVGDRPYYEGAEFWDWGWRYVWVPGHWDRHHHWIHGYYMRQGDWNGRYGHKRHHWRHHDHEDHDHDHHH